MHAAPYAMHLFSFALKAHASPTHSYVPCPSCFASRTAFANFLLCFNRVPQVRSSAAMCWALSQAKACRGRSRPPLHPLPLDEATTMPGAACCCIYMTHSKPEHFNDFLCARLPAAVAGSMAEAAEQRQPLPHINFVDSHKGNHILVQT